MCAMLPASAAHHTSCIMHRRAQHHTAATEPNLPPASSQVEKEASFFKMKTKFTANPCSSTVKVAPGQ